jgi:hypothetical protein
MAGHNYLKTKYWDFFDHTQSTADGRSHSIMLPSGDVELLGATVDDAVQRNVMSTAAAAAATAAATTTT